jgi:hypothetical protein
MGQPTRDAAGLSGLGFAYRVHKTGEVTITRNGRRVTVLRGGAARDFGARAAALSPGELQAAMARITGRYKRGNERSAAQHPRNRS